MLALLIVLQVIVAVFLILVVLLQPGNKGGMSAAFGGAGGETVFGGRGANTFLAKLTFGAAALFMICSVSLSFMSMMPKSVVGEALKEEIATQPPKAAQPANPGAAPAPSQPAPESAAPKTESEVPAAPASPEAAPDAKVPEAPKK